MGSESFLSCICICPPLKSFNLSISMIVNKQDQQISKWQNSVNSMEPRFLCNQKIDNISWNEVSEYCPSFVNLGQKEFGAHHQREWHVFSSRFMHPISNATFFSRFWPHCVHNGALCYLAHCRKLIEYVLYVITYRNKELRND